MKKFTDRLCEISLQYEAPKFWSKELISEETFSQVTQLGSNLVDKQKNTLIIRSIMSTLKEKPELFEDLCVILESFTMAESVVREMRS